jgi:hypothetical protein
VADLEILAQGVDRELRPHQVRQAQDEQLEVAQILDPLEAHHLLADQQVAVLA